MRGRDVILWLILLGTALLFFAAYNPMHYHGMMGVIMYSWGPMLLIPAVLIALIMVGAYLALTHFTKSNEPVLNRGGRALEILKERYAKGEVMREEYLKMKQEIES